MLVLAIWLCASILAGAFWALAGWLLGRREADPLIAEKTLEVGAEEEAA